MKDSRLRSKTNRCCRIRLNNNNRCWLGKNLQMQWHWWMTSWRITTLELGRRCRRMQALWTIGTNQVGNNPCQPKLKCSRKFSIATLTFLINLVKSNSVRTSNFLSLAPKCSIIHKLSHLPMVKLHLPCLLILLRRSTWVSTTLSSRPSFKLSRCCRNSSYSRLLSKLRTQCHK